MSAPELGINLRQPWQQQMYDTAYDLYVVRYAAAAEAAHSPDFFTTAVHDYAGAISLAHINEASGTYISARAFDLKLVRTISDIVSRELSVDPERRLSPYNRILRTIRTLESSAHDNIAANPAQSIQDVCSLGVIAGLHLPEAVTDPKSRAVEKMHSRLYGQAEESLNLLRGLRLAPEEEQFVPQRRDERESWPEAFKRANRKLIKARENPDTTPAACSYTNKRGLISLSDKVLTLLDTTPPTRPAVEEAAAIAGGRLPIPIERARRVLHEPPRRRLDLLMFPPEHLASRAVREGEAEAPRQGGTTQERVVEKYRMEWLGYLAAVWGNGAEVTDIDLRYSGTDKYQAAILPDGNGEVVAVVADNPELGNALYEMQTNNLSDPDTGLPIPWQRVASGSRAWALQCGARRYIHSSPTMYSRVVESLLPLNANLQR